MCSKEKEVTDCFKSFSQSPNPKDVYKTVMDVLRHITIVDSLTDSTLERVQSNLSLLIQGLLWEL